ncbi:MAG: META domain-containing protein [Actinomycetota bacterium]|nr:META domain-containing protein [Actinomycetota bacterium]
MTTILRLLATAVVVLALAACGGAADTSSTTTTGDDAPDDGATDDGGDAVVGRTWVLDALTVDGEDVTAASGTTPTITFGVDGEVSGSGPCNQYVGSYVRDGESVELSGLGWTEMGCVDQSVMEAEQAFFTALPTVETMAVVDGLLVLDGPDATFEWSEQEPVADAPLEGTAWQLDTFLDAGPDGAASSTIADVEVTLVVEDGRVSGDTGCNDYGGDVTIDGDTFTVGQLEQTEMACTEPPGVMDQEARYLERLGATTTWVIEGERLTLTAGDGSGLSYRAAADAVAVDADG